MFSFNGASFKTSGSERQTSICRQDLLKLRDELLPPRLGTAKGLLLIRHLAVQHATPISTKTEPVPHDRLEVVLHEPLLDQVRLGERAPYLFRRIRHLAFENHGACFGRSTAHWSILFSRFSRSSNRLCQKPAIWLVHSIRGTRPCGLAR